MLTYLGRRLLSGFITLLGVIIVVFFLSRLTGSPIDLFFPEGAEPAQIEAFNRAYGLDKPLIEQFGIFLVNVGQGDFGTSIWQQRPAMEAALSEMPMTLVLASIAMSISILVALVLGSLAAVYRFRAIDRIVTILSLMTSSMPHFWFALVGILIFAVQLRLLPTSGSNSWMSWILPVATVSIGPIGVLTQVVRGAMIDVLSSGYIRNARARGFSGRRIVYRHALRNAALPIISVAGDIAAGMVNGAVIVSVVFAFPGIGRLIVGAILNRDFPVLQACVVVVGISIILLNLLIDLICTVVDPRIKLT
ncbi:MULTISPECIES: ABC transporter permease [Rhizobium]|uniref:ABC transporter permease n=1 Tax=Rhizobium hidalgonense TaxID=1538159 RepID=A0AAJ2GWS6_9HYPH|nr:MULTISPECIES: ABC transporter permease [Rhizobium]ANK95479.1 dipeptide/oligopeptide ABC transporter permease protein [Rhizobium sp. N6212]ANL01531.1 dipeptide/oligopeptide ABC transporter permease protein [Rhizobium sp. N621]ANL07659.1 dipeptide/oligopeptide ABC transporter permease protein [Rhizobium esperanzae]ANL13829.1 dipeptide/oligopeptide ABC transporter permease protein [Rhizobium sp. N1341]ANL25816.1 dipeptide/oligopeptide ABC transporter permease protein [Rhizobium sp. N113]